MTHSHEELANSTNVAGKPDAELLRLGDELTTLIDEINAGLHPEDADSSDRAMDRKGDLEKRIAATPANTFGGIAVKLRIATDNMDPDAPRYGDELNLLSVFADAKRLAGEPFESNPTNRRT